MSDTPPSTPDAPAGGDKPKAGGKPGKGIKGALSKKVGPLPVGVWLLAIGGGLAIAAVMRRRSNNAAAAAEGTATEGTGSAWDQLDPGGTAPGVGGGTGNGGGATNPWDDYTTMPELPEVLPWLDSPWQDPPEASVPGTMGGATTAQPSNGGPAAIGPHAYVRKAENDPHCRVCGKWRDTSVHTNREEPKHLYVRKAENDPHCRVCGKWRDTAEHTNRAPGPNSTNNLSPPKPSPSPAPAQPPAPTPGVVAPLHKYEATSKTQPKCRVCGKWRDTAGHSNRG